MPTGTHDIKDITVNKTQNNAVKVTTVYNSEPSDAKGALYIFVFIDDSNTTRLTFFALDKNDSHDYTLPFNKLLPGNYTVFVYDIEHDGTLSDGIGYPAARDMLLTSNEYKGNLKYASVKKIILVYELYKTHYTIHTITVYSLFNTPNTS